MAWEKLGSTKVGTLTPDTSDDLTTDKGWVSNTNDWSYNATNDTIDLATIRRSTTAQRIYIDLQDADYLGSGNNLSDTSWVIRLGKFKVNSLGTGGGVLAIIGVSSSTDDSGTNQDAVAFDYAFNTSELFIRLKALDGVNFEGAGQVSDAFSSSIVPSTSTSYRWELVRNGSVFTLTAFAENDTTYSTPLETATVTKTGITGLRYFKIINDSEQNNSVTADMEIFGDIKIWNGVTSVADVTDTITVSDLAAKKHLMVQYHIIPSGSLDNISSRFNNDTGSNYTYRYSTDGATDGTVTSHNKIRFRSGGAVSNDFFGVLNIINESSKEKLLISEQIRNNTNGAGNAPSRAEVVGKWANTSNQITRIDISQDGSGSFDADSEVTVYGSD